MNFRQILRTQLIVTRRAHLNRLQLVCRAEVALLAKTFFFVVLLNMLFTVNAAEHDCPTIPGGGSGTPAVPHHQQVWFVC